MNSAIETQYFMESYNPTKITISPSDNEGGFLEVDENGNGIGSGLIGEQIIYKCTAFTGITANKYVLLYDTSQNIVGMFNGTYDKETNDITNCRNNFKVHKRQILYKINADIETTSFSGSSVTLSDYSSSTDTIFKVYLNGEDVTDTYTRIGDTLTFSESNQFGNDIFVIYYPNTQTLTGTPDVNIELYYYSPYKHLLNDMSEVLLGYDLSATGTVSAGSNEVTTSIDLTSILNIGDDIRIQDFASRVANIDATTIYLYNASTESFTTEDIYKVPCKMLVNIENESENMSPSFYTFDTKGIKMPVTIKESIDNKFTFDYFIDDGMEVSRCNIYNYISNDLQKEFPTSNRMRYIRLNIEEETINEFYILTNVRKITSFNYSKGNPNKYNAELQFEDRLNLIYDDKAYGDGIYGLGGYGGYRLVVN